MLFKLRFSETKTFFYAAQFTNWFIPEGANPNQSSKVDAKLDRREMGFSIIHARKRATNVRTAT